MEKRCQTTETSLGPCLSCSKLQQCLRAHGDGLINLCQTYNLPSSLAQHRCTNPDLLSSDEINHWSDCQSKDIDRLSKHLEYLNNTLNKTKSDLQLNENRCKKQEENNRRLQQSINDDKQSKKELQEFHDKKVLELKTDSEQKERNLHQQVQFLTNQKNQLEQKLKEVNELCRTKEEQVEKLGKERTMLKDGVHCEMI